MTTQDILARLEEIGKKLANDANPQYYSYEDRDRAKYYVPWLAKCRECYADIRTGLTGGAAIVSLRILAKTINTSGHSNAISLLIRDIEASLQPENKALNDLR